MIEAIPEKPGWLRVHDAQGRRHLISVFAMKKPRPVTTETTFVPMNEYKDLFVRVPADEVRAAAKRARTLRKAQQATANRGQLAFDFGEKETAVQLPTETAAANAHHTDEVRSDES